MPGPRDRVTEPTLNDHPQGRDTPSVQGAVVKEVPGAAEQQFPGKGEGSNRRTAPVRQGGGGQ